MGIKLARQSGQRVDERTRWIQSVGTAIEDQEAGQLEDFEMPKHRVLLMKLCGPEKVDLPPGGSGQATPPAR